TPRWEDQNHVAIPCHALPFVARVFQPFPSAPRNSAATGGLDMRPARHLRALLRRIGQEAAMYEEFFADMPDAPPEIGHALARVRRATAATAGGPITEAQIDEAVGALTYCANVFLRFITPANGEAAYVQDDLHRDFLRRHRHHLQQLHIDAQHL